MIRSVITCCTRFFNITGLLGLCSLPVLVLFSISPAGATVTPTTAAAMDPSETLILAEQGESVYRIVLPESPTDEERRAADVLQEHLLEISGAALPIVTADVPAGEREILLGRNERLDRLDPELSLRDMEEDGFTIRTLDNRLVIMGGTGKGTLYGVYHFLEQYLGARLYTPDVKVLPEMDRIELGSIDDIQIPEVRARFVHYDAAWDAEYADWHKLSHAPDGSLPDWGMFVHTFNRLVPPDDYYDDHPEYYAMVDGERIPTQLCLTNEDVLEITIRNLRREIRQNPEATYWSVSQNDNQEYCTCDRCSLIDEREGSGAGTMIHFVNQVAEHFPDRVISTLAYQYSRRPPANLQPRENVNIMLTNIELDRHLSMSDNPEAADFRNDLEGWGEISDDIFLWDYVIQFHNLLAPYPNLHTLGPNARYLADHGVTAMFKQGNRETGGEFAGLRAYMLSKLVWDPDADPREIMEDYLQGYYGEAASHILEYIDLMHRALTESGDRLRIFGSSPNEAADSYLTPELIDRYETLFDRAEEAVVEDRDLLRRVRAARMPLEFAILEQAKQEYTGDRGLFEKIDGEWRVRPEMRDRIDSFTDRAELEGVTRVKEWSTPPMEYRSTVYRLFYHGMNEHLGYGREAEVSSPTDPDVYSPEQLRRLTDGKRGGHTFLYNWLTVSGEDLDVVIDLEEIKTVRRMESAWYQHAQWLMILPETVEYYVSEHGRDFELVARIGHDLPIDQYGAQIRDFIGEFEPREARYVRMRAVNIGQVPPWHPTPAGAGRPANMRVDEFVVE